MSSPIGKSLCLLMETWPTVATSPCRLILQSTQDNDNNQLLRSMRARGRVPPRSRSTGGTSICAPYTSRGRLHSAGARAHIGLHQERRRELLGRAKHWHGGCKRLLHLLGFNRLLSLVGRAVTGRRGCRRCSLCAGAINRVALAPCTAPRRVRHLVRVARAERRRKHRSCGRTTRVVVVVVVAVVIIVVVI